MNRKLIILWTETIRLEDISMSSYAGNCGLYQIVTNEGGSPETEKVIYIGKTNSTFSQRIYQHLLGTGDSGGFLKAKGTKYIRFGLIPRPFKCSDKTYARMIAHAEAVDIELLRPVYNKKSGWTIPEYRDTQVENCYISNIINLNFI